MEDFKKNKIGDDFDFIGVTNSDLTIDGKKFEGKLKLVFMEDGIGFLVPEQKYSDDKKFEDYNSEDFYVMKL